MVEELHRTGIDALLRRFAFTAALRGPSDAVLSTPLPARIGALLPPVPR